LFAQGYPVNWSEIYPAGHFVRLPDYPWQRERYWIAPGSPAPVPSRPAGAHPLLGRRLRLASPEIVFEAEVGPDDPALLADHRLGAQALFPAAGFAEMALAAGLAWSARPLCLEG